MDAAPTPITEPCCACGAAVSQPFQELSYPEHRYPGTFTLRRCAGCGLIFNAPRLADEAVRRLYQENYYFFDRRADRELYRQLAVYQRTVALVEKKIPEKRVLEIGCGKGYLGALLQERGWRVAAVEIAEAAARSARATFGLDVFTGTVEEYCRAHPGETFPLVLAVDVIEHVPDPHAFAGALAAVTAPGGTVVIDTPNAAAANIATQGSAWPGFNPFHIFLFNLVALEKLLTAAGFRVTEDFSYGNRPVAGPTLKDRALQLLRRLGLAPFALRLYYRLRRCPWQRDDVPTALTAVTAAAATAMDYRMSADGRAAAAAARAGDNLVVIASRNE